MAKLVDPSSASIDRRLACYREVSWILAVSIGVVHENLGCGFDGYANGSCNGAKHNGSAATC
jgi:hypothetical protein